MVMEVNENEGQTIRTDFAIQLWIFHWEKDWS